MVSNKEPPTMDPGAARSTCMAASFLQSRAAPFVGGNGVKCRPAGAGAATAVTASSVENVMAQVAVGDRRLARLAAAGRRLLCRNRMCWLQRGEEVLSVMATGVERAGWIGGGLVSGDGAARGVYIGRGGWPTCRGCSWEHLLLWAARWLGKCITDWG